MSHLEIKPSILQSIKAAIDKRIATDHQTLNTLVMTETLRHDILNILMTYSDKIPHPASGDHSQTLIRWQILACVAGIDLTLAKWFESHLDALSILHELGYREATQGLWAVWAAEGHPNPIRYQEGKISGTKSWCSGAGIVDDGLLTYQDESGQSQLLVVSMQQAGIEIDNGAWHAVGMQATDTATIHFNQAAASNVGAANAYLERAGFWHGAAGVAACWYGATISIAGYLIKAYQQKPHDYKAMYLGQISTSLSVTQQYFYHVAHLIDSQPTRSHELAIRQLRANVEQLARDVIAAVGQALGAAPFCGNAHFARLSADLPVFIRQSHGAFDLQKIGELSSVLATELNNDSINEQENIWQL